MFTRKTSPELRNARRDLINASYPRKPLGVWYPTTVALAFIVGSAVVVDFIESLPI